MGERIVRVDARIVLIGAPKASIGAPIVQTGAREDSIRAPMPSIGARSVRSRTRSVRFETRKVSIRARSVRFDAPIVRDRARIVSIDLANVPIGAREEAIVLRSNGLALRSKGSALRNEASWLDHEPIAPRKEQSVRREEPTARQSDPMAPRNDGSAGPIEGLAPQNRRSLDDRAHRRIFFSQMALSHQHDKQNQGPLTRAEYEELVRRGALEDAHVELLYGRVVSMSPIGGPHRYSVRHLARILLTALGDRANIEVQASFAAPDESEPEPDILVAPPGDYLDAPPSVAWLIVEVADSSLARDRAKAALYAAAAVTEYWIVNLHDGVIEVHRQPGPTGYASLVRRGRGEKVTLAAFADVEVLVSDVLPPEER
jgi:Uma2 family endonuclease